MNHLTKEEIQQFVSFKTLDQENLKLAAKVNSHILECDACLNAVRELQERYDSILCTQEEDTPLCGFEKEEQEETISL